MSHLLSAILILVLLLNLAGCSDARDPRLERVNALTLTNPQAAMAALDSIDPATLNDADRHFRDLLAVKTADKAYITHSSDSLILDVIDYYSSGYGRDLRAEALYYGGRVYSDMGDYPTALHYFQNALDLLPDDTTEQRLRSCILSQTGRLLNQLRLNEQAISCLEDAIRIEIATTDSINLMWDYDLLGTVYLNMKDYSQATMLYTKARKLAELISTEDIPAMDINLGRVKFYQGDITGALSHIRPAIDRTDSLTRRWVLAVASEMYSKAGIRDTAAIYACALVCDTTDSYQLNGYDVLLSPEMAGVVSKDSIAEYALAFRKAMLRHLRKNASTDALIQNTMFNYQTHLKERFAAERSKSLLERWIAIAVVVILSLCVLIFYMKQRNARSIIKLIKAQELIESLQNAIAEKNSGRDINPCDDIKTRILNNLNSITKGDVTHVSVSTDILGSGVYKQIKKILSQNRNIPDKSPVWIELESMILTTSENFKTSLQILNEGDLDETNYRMLLLLKCGMKPSEIACLLSVAPGTITYRRTQLSKRFFPQKISTQGFDKLISLL